MDHLSRAHPGQGRHQDIPKHLLGWHLIALWMSNDDAKREFPEIVLELKTAIDGEKDVDLPLAPIGDGLVGTPGPTAFPDSAHRPRWSEFPEPGRHSRVDALVDRDTHSATSC